MYISVQKLRPHAQIPKRATAQSAGYDLYALPEKPLTIQPQEICKVPTGIAVAPSRPDVACASSSLRTFHQARHHADQQCGAGGQRLSG